MVKCWGGGLDYSYGTEVCFQLNYAGTGNKVHLIAYKLRKHILPVLFFEDILIS